MVRQVLAQRYLLTDKDTGILTSYFLIENSPGKGLGAFATKPIRPGTVVLAETPLYILPKHYKSDWTRRYPNGLQPA